MFRNMTWGPPIRQEMCMAAWHGAMMSGQLQHPATLQWRVSALQHCSTVTMSPSTELQLITADTHGRMQSLATLLATLLMSVLMAVLTTFLWQFNSAFLPRCIIINYIHHQPHQPGPHATPGTQQPTPPLISAQVSRPGRSGVRTREPGIINTGMFWSCPWKFVSIYLFVRNFSFHFNHFILFLVMTLCGFEIWLFSCLEFMLRQVLPLQSITGGWLSAVTEYLLTIYLPMRCST